MTTQVDQFKADYAKAQDIYKNINSQNQKRKNAAASNQPTSKFEAFLRTQLETLNIQIQALEKSVIKAEASGLQPKEKEKRKTLVNQLRAEFNFLRDGILEEVNAPKQTKNVFSGKPLRGVDGESEEIKEKSNKDLHFHTQELMKKQDEQLEELHGVVKGIKYGQQAIGQEADTHMKLLDQAETEMDRTTANIVIVDSKLKSLIKSSNTCCLWIVIIIELVLIGLVVWWII